jgi:predicted amidophosphoribosyltransferase
MSDAFKITDHSKIRGKTIFLVDDVITTGITLGSCATALMGAGAERVLAISFARRMLIEPVKGRSIHGD